MPGPRLSRLMPAGAALALALTLGACSAGSSESSAGSAPMIAPSSGVNERAVSGVDAGKQADKAVAAIIQQNVGFTDFFNQLSAAGAAGAIQAAGTPDTLRPLTAAAAQAGQDQFKWWQNLTWVVDNSASMAARVPRPSLRRTKS